MSKFSGLWNRITGTFPRVSTMFQSMEVTGAIHVDVKQFSEIPEGGAAYLTNVTSCVGILGSTGCGRQYLFHKFIENSQEDLQHVLADAAIEEATLFLNLDTARTSTNYGSESHADNLRNRADVTAAFKELDIKTKNVQFPGMSVLVMNNCREVSFHKNFTPFNSKKAEGVILAAPALTAEKSSTAADSSYYNYRNNHVKNLNREESQTDISAYRK